MNTHILKHVNTESKYFELEKCKYKKNKSINTQILLPVKNLNQINSQFTNNDFMNILLWIVDNIIIYNNHTLILLIQQDNLNLGSIIIIKRSNFKIDICCNKQRHMHKNNKLPTTIDVINDNATYCFYSINIVFNVIFPTNWKKKNQKTFWNINNILKFDQYLKQITGNKISINNFHTYINAMLLENLF